MWFERWHVKAGDRGPLVADLQLRLQKLGFDPGPCDGTFTPQTHSVLVAYQRSAGLLPGAQEGVADTETWRSLCVRTGSSCEILSLAPTQEDSAGPTPVRYALIIHLLKQRAYLFREKEPVQEFPVSIGASTTPTPIGSFTVRSKVRHPGGSFGIGWIGWGHGNGIHGTNRPWTVGYEPTTGSVRMYNRDIARLLEVLHVGSTLLITEDG